MKMFIFLISIFCISCSSSPYRNTLTATAVGVAVGGLYGLNRPEYQSQNATMYGALGGLIAGTGALLLDIDSNQNSEMRSENERLKIKLNEFQNRLEPKLISSGNSLFNSPLPKEVAGLIEPGEWKRYKLDQWVQDPGNPNAWYRQVELFEVIPPTPR